jgi:hypothetical protein
MGREIYSLIFLEAVSWKLQCWHLQVSDA